MQDKNMRQTQVGEQKYIQGKMLGFLNVKMNVNWPIHHRGYAHYIQFFKSSYDTINCCRDLSRCREGQS